MCTQYIFVYAVWDLFRQYAEPLHPAIQSSTNIHMKGKRSVLFPHELTGKRISSHPDVPRCHTLKWQHRTFIAVIWALWYCGKISACAFPYFLCITSPPSCSARCTAHRVFITGGKDLLFQWSCLVRDWSAEFQAKECYVKIRSNKTSYECSILLPGASGLLNMPSLGALPVAISAAT